MFCIFLNSSQLTVNVAFVLKEMKVSVCVVTVAGGEREIDGGSSWEVDDSWVASRPRKMVQKISEKASHGCHAKCNELIS
jgi:hypothetical protein